MLAERESVGPFEKGKKRALVQKQKIKKEPKIVSIKSAENCRQRMCSAIV